MNDTASRAWPFQEAARLLERVTKHLPRSGAVLFETGYGPSGLPHIGTFGEVARTAMVRHAFSTISDLPTKLICFSDDMDGMRKIPDNVPNPEMLSQHLGKPLTQVPDPFGTHESFGAHNNARLRAFLDGFGFEYEFLSATECYRSGRFDNALRTALKRCDAIMKVMLPTLGAERQASYSPFLPISPKSGQVLYVPMQRIDDEAGTITFLDDGEEITLPVTGGHCKLQWKPDFGMRWAALGVDFEMYGKDHLVNGKIYSAICQVLGGTPPEQFNYELFLDEKGEKISKSKGNGVTIEEWLAYGPQESLALYMYQSPKKAKRLHFDVIPKAVDEYLTFLEKFPGQDEATQKENPVWHIHAGHPPVPEVAGLTFGLLLNLASVCNPEDKSVLWGFISRYAPRANPQNSPFLDRLAGFAVRYYHDFIKPAKSFRAPTAQEEAALRDLEAMLRGLPKEADAETIQTAVYDIGMKHGFEPLRAWFSCMYEVLLGQIQGPRMGSFIALYGVEESAELIGKALSGQVAA